jgi:uncharacterized protein involved in exopolysaccharide biosynthesis
LNSRAANKGNHLAKTNYQFEKRQRDLAKKQKQEDKRRQKLADKAAAEASDLTAESAIIDTSSTSGPVDAAR